MTEPPWLEGIPDGVGQFVDGINSHDLAALGEAMSVGHEFVDGVGNVIRGRAATLEAWREYLAIFPDYRIEVERVYAGAAGVALFGRASGTLFYEEARRPDTGGHWSIPAAWEAEVEEGRVRVWRVYANTAPVRRLLMLEEPD